MLSSHTSASPGLILVRPASQQLYPGPHWFTYGSPLSKVTVGKGFKTIYSISKSI